MKVIILIAILIVAFVWYDKNLNQGTSGSINVETVVPDSSKVEKVSQVQTFTCDGRTYCSQMTSCEEAKFFLKNCPDPKMDGNKDGIPCERQWCN